MKTMVNNLTISFGLICLTLCALADTASVTNVTVRQRWPWDRKVDINYQLTADPGQQFDITVTARNGTQLLTLDYSLSGDLYGVGPGLRSIVWDPMESSYTNQTLTQFNVSLTLTNTPLYMIIDLTKNAGEEGQITHVYEDDLISGTYGSVETNPVSGVTSIIWTGVTNDTQYMTTKLVLRRVKAGSYQMGGSFPVTLTKDFYAGVFELTQSQWRRIMGDSTPDNTYPKANIYYDVMRGSDIGANWPSSHAVDPGSFFYTLRTKTGIAGFDLPSEAQAEYCLRAETTSFYYDGVTTGTDTNVLNELAWWSGNSGNATHPVGKKRPNAWGLYDTIANVGEWCLDWWANSVTGGVDPVGPDSPVSGTGKVYRGLHYTGDAYGCRSSGRNWYNTISGKVGLRVVIWLP